MADLRMEDVPKLARRKNPPRCLRCGLEIQEKPGKPRAWYCSSKCSDRDTPASAIRMLAVTDFFATARTNCDDSLTRDDIHAMATIIR
jgi:hypothetical protein